MKKLNGAMNYKMEELIGQGSFGKVYKGTHHITN